MTWDGALGQMGLYEGSRFQKPLVGASWMRPGSAADAVRVFTLPYTGSVTITGTVHKDIYHTYGDGVRVKVLKNNEQIWPGDGWLSIAASDVAGKNMDVKIPVQKGDKLFFVVNCNGDPSDDDTVWNPQIAYDRIDGALRRPARSVTNDNNSRLKYSGRGWQKLGLSLWGGDVDQGYLPGWTQGTLSVSGTAGDGMSFKFRGTGVEIIGQTGSDRGIASITLDGKQVATIDTFVPEDNTSPTVPQVRAGSAALWANVPGTRLWGIQCLDQGEHTLEVAVTGRKNDASIGTFIGIDGVVVLDGTVTDQSRSE
jgi:hypothetical protein